MRESGNVVMVVKSTAGGGVIACEAGASNAVVVALTPNLHI